jgi:hypothetical protein
MTFYLIRTNSAGYETAYCTNSDWSGLNYCSLPGAFKIERMPTIKTWKTEAGVRRWMAERPGFKAEIRSA